MKEPLNDNPALQQVEQPPVQNAPPTEEQKPVEILEQKPMAAPLQQQPLQPGAVPVQPNQQPLQPGAVPVQPNQQPLQPGMMPMQPGMPTQPGMPMQPGMMPMQPGMMPMQPGMMPMQPGMMPMQPGMMPMQPGMMPMQPALLYGMPIQNYVFSEDPFQELAAASKALIVQQVELLEMMTGCETKNRYHVFCNVGGIEKLLFKCKEESSCCERNCCASDLRPFSMKVKHIKSLLALQEREFNQNIFAEFNRPFKCTCCCCNRPVMTGVLKSTNVQVGRVIQPCNCCDPLFNVYDKNNMIKYRVTIDCCSCGFCCRRGCGMFMSVEFKIHAASDKNLTGKPVGIIKKKVKGLQELFTDADTYEITFPQDATPEDKFMLIGAVLLIDYRFFEDNGNSKVEINGVRVR